MDSMCYMEMPLDQGQIQDFGKGGGEVRVTAKGANPQRVSTEIIIEIKQLYSGRIASNPSIESIWCTH